MDTIHLLYKIQHECCEGKTSVLLIAGKVHRFATVLAHVIILPKEIKKKKTGFTKWTQYICYIKYSMNFVRVKWVFY